MTHDTDPKCTCPDLWCPVHATCGLCGGEVIVTYGDPAFCPACAMDVMPAGACRFTGDGSDD